MLIILFAAASKCLSSYLVFVIVSNFYWEFFSEVNFLWETHFLSMNGGDISLYKTFFRLANTPLVLPDLDQYVSF